MSQSEVLSREVREEKMMGLRFRNVDQVTSDTFERAKRFVAFERLAKAPTV